MDYTTQKLTFRIKKAARYIRLYGVQRTLIKIRGQYHMKKRYLSLPAMSTLPEDGGHVGLIGCGNYAFGVVAYYLKRNFGRVLRGAMDIDIHKAASLYEQFGLRYYTDDAEKIIVDPAIDLIYIATNHASHADYAIRALRAGKSVHIEKPHVVRLNQLERLCATMAECPGQIGLGFNRPYSRIGREIKRALDSQTGAAMFNWFIAGHEISPEHWYFKEEEGGRVLGNLCHWTDFVLQLVAPQDRYPLTINPTRGLKSDCDIAVTFTFGDESIAAITFSAKGHTFEGVRERFAAYRGNVLISMDDFRDLTVEIIEKKRRISPFFRDHGHELNILRSYAMVRPQEADASKGYSIGDVWETGNLFLKTRDALETDRKIVIHGYGSGA
ncbi:Gfo/Idh/MocA family oxidoreductase [uncultured Lamprocystis sp.]|uniref:Gfo/Idh/MocA family protein n=1 Tax=uncultured Lamprocystis sp. TaxID=543132 RepID=UPI0025FF1D63|nr:Gfo/Idh/MocA family oxidoreductase [uncultured Lamprocystis sp.]